MFNNTEVIDELSMNQESASPAWAMFGIVLLLPWKKELGKCQNYLGARRPWSLFTNKILWKVTTTKNDKYIRSTSQTRPWLTIKDPNCSPLESGVTCSLLLSSSDSSWGLVRDTGEAGGGGSARLSESPLMFTSSEMVSQGCRGRDAVVSAGTRDPLVPAMVITILTIVHIYWVLRRHSVFPASLRKIRLLAWLTDEETEAEGVTGTRGQWSKQAWLKGLCSQPLCNSTSLSSGLLLDSILLAQVKKYPQEFTIFMNFLLL